MVHAHTWLYETLARLYTKEDQAYQLTPFACLLARSVNYPELKTRLRVDGDLRSFNLLLTLLFLFCAMRPVLISCCLLVVKSVKGKDDGGINACKWSGMGRVE